VSALVPIFSEYFVTTVKRTHGSLASTLIIGVALVLACAAALGAWLAPVYVPWIARFPRPPLGRSESR